MEYHAYYSLVLILLSDPSILEFLTLFATVHLGTDFPVHTLVAHLQQRVTSSASFKHDDFTRSSSLEFQEISASLAGKDSVSRGMTNLIFHSIYVFFRLINDTQIQISFQSAPLRTRFVYFDLSRFHALRDILTIPDPNDISSLHPTKITDPNAFLEYIQSFSDYLSSLINTKSPVITMCTSPLIRNTEFTPLKYDHLDSETVLLSTALSSIDLIQSYLICISSGVTSITSQSFEPLAIAKSITHDKTMYVYDFLYISKIKVTCPDIRTPASIAQPDNPTPWNTLPHELHEAISSEVILQCLQPDCQCSEVPPLMHSRQESFICHMPIHLTCQAQNDSTFNIDILANLQYVRPFILPKSHSDYGVGFALNPSRRLTLSASHCPQGQPLHSSTPITLTQLQSQPEHQLCLTPSDLYPIITSHHTTKKCALQPSTWCHS